MLRDISEDSFILNNNELEESGVNIYELYLLGKEFLIDIDLIKNPEYKKKVVISLLTKILQQNQDNTDAEMLISQNLDYIITNYQEEFYKIPINSLQNIFFHKKRILKSHEKAYQFIIQKQRLNINNELFSLLPSLDGEKLTPKTFIESISNQNEHFGFCPKIDIFTLLNIISPKVINYNGTIDEYIKTNKKSSRNIYIFGIFIFFVSLILMFTQFIPTYFHDFFIIQVSSQIWSQIQKYFGYYHDDKELINNNENKNKILKNVFEYYTPKYSVEINNLFSDKPFPNAIINNKEELAPIITFSLMNKNVPTTKIIAVKHDYKNIEEEVLTKQLVSSKIEGECCERKLVFYYQDQKRYKITNCDNFSTYTSTEPIKSYSEQILIPEGYKNKEEEILTKQLVSSKIEGEYCERKLVFYYQDQKRYKITNCDNFSTYTSTEPIKSYSEQILIPEGYKNKEEEILTKQLVKFEYIGEGINQKLINYFEDQRRYKLINCNDTITYTKHEIIKSYIEEIGPKVYEDFKTECETYDNIHHINRPDFFLKRSPCVIQKPPFAPRTICTKYKRNIIISPDRNVIFTDWTELKT